MSEEKGRQKQAVLFESMTMPSIEEIRQAMFELPRGELGKIGKEMGVSISQMSNWKTAQKNPSYPRAVQLITALRERGLLE
jgi:DNA-binding transcriptional regulator YiaG